AVLAALSPGSGVEPQAAEARPPEAPGGREALAALWGRSREHLSMEREKLDAALLTERVADALRALHNLTSLAKMVGAAPISEAARNVESRLRARESLAEVLTELDGTLASYRPASGGGGGGGGGTDGERR
ncbi:MAG: Hpt domain-containing protein, partial [Burkholderiales bacterium]|nr:Hpt domain-containing protein [Opitutaceae bacterium]